MLNLFVTLLFVVLASTYSSASAQTPTPHTKGGWAATTCFNLARGTSPVTQTATTDFYRPESGLENNSSEVAYVGCGVGTTRDSRRVYVDFMDANATYPISCWLNVVQWNGVNRQIAAKASTAGNSIPYRGFFEFYVPPTYPGYVIITCQLPPSTSILGWNTVTLPGE